MKQKTKKVCSVDGCGGSSWARGLCCRHYFQYRDEKKKLGVWVNISKTSDRMCGMNGCVGKHLADGMCQKHYSEEIRRKNREFLMGRYFKDGIICGKCGKTFMLVQMDFHHLDPNCKEHTLGYFINNSALQRRAGLIAEMDGCQKLCARCHQNTHYDPKTSHESTYDKSNHRKGRQVDRRKEMVRVAFGEKCMKCGDWLWPKEMEFHHREKSDKFDNLSDMFRTNSKDAILREVSKCDILCRNCHRLITDDNKDTVSVCKSK